MKVVVERFCPNEPPSFSSLWSRQETFRSCSNWVWGPQKKGGPKRPVGGLAGLVSKEGPLYDGKLRNLLQYFRKKNPSTK